MIKRTLGIDLSHWESLIDWSVAYQWVPFVYYKCTDGIKYVDETFAANKQGCNEFGVPHAPFHYFQPHADPKMQAAHFLDIAGAGYRRLIVDVEEPPTDRNLFAPNLQTFLQQLGVMSHGIPIAIYTSPGFWNEWLARPFPMWAQNYDLLVANYSILRHPTIPIGWGKWVIWQFSVNFWFPGCIETADANWFNGDLDEMRSWFGNYRQVDPPVYNRSRVRSLFPSLNIRQAPAQRSRSVGKLTKGEVIEIQDVGGSNAWVKHERGWSCVEMNDYRYMEVLKE